MIEWSAAGRAFHGEPESGDRFLVEETARGALLAVVDGLGHGPFAAEAAREAAAALEGRVGWPLEVLFAEVHARLKGTRGAVATVAQVDDAAATVAWAGVGNVEGTLFHAAGPREALVNRGGILGVELGRVHPRTAALTPGDVLVLSSDGVRAGWAASVQTLRPVQQIAQTIINTHARASDDALVLAVRWRGPGAAT